MSSSRRKSETSGHGYSDYWDDYYEPRQRKKRESRHRSTKYFLSAVIITTLLGVSGLGVETARRKGILKDIGAKITALFVGNENSTGDDVNRVIIELETPNVPTPTAESNQPNLEATPEPTATPTTESNQPNLEATPESTPTPTIEFETQYIDGGVLRVTLDKIPVDLTLDSGEVITFDRQQMDELRKRAIESQEPVMVAYYRVQSTDVETELQQNQSSTEHPIYEQLPADFITSEAELASHNVEIMQGEVVELYIRQSAFAEGGLLHHLEGAERNLRIVVVEGPFVSRKFLSPTQLAVAGDLLPTEPEEAIVQYRQKLIEEDQKLLRDCRASLAKLIGGGNEADELMLYELQINIQYLQADIYALQTGLTTDDELFLQMHATDRMAGLYDAGWIENTSTVFVAVGGKSSPIGASEFVYVGFDPFGQPVTKVYPQPSLKTGMSIKRDKSQPDPSEFKREDVVAPHTMLYPWGGVASGSTLRHELVHDLLVQTGVWPIYDQDGKTIIGWEKKIIGGEEANLPDYSEYDTDTAAMEKLLKAWNKWKESGFTDNSGYEFAFLLPGGGYLLTMDGSKPSTQPDKLVNYKPQVDVHSRFMIEQANRRINQALVSARMTARS